MPSASVSSASVSSALTSRCARRRNRRSLPLRASLHSRTAFRQRARSDARDSRGNAGLLSPRAALAVATGARSRSLPLRASLHSRTAFRVQSSSLRRGVPSLKLPMKRKSCTISSRSTPSPPSSRRAARTRRRYSSTCAKRHDAELVHPAIARLRPGERRAAHAAHVRYAP